MTEHKLTYELHGTRGAVYVSAPSPADATAMFLASFPDARIVSCEVAS